MAKKQKQPTKTCSDCIHESACRLWTDGRYISDSSASKCPNYETVKESSAYLCGVLDERKRKQSNYDRIKAMSVEELAEFLLGIDHYWDDGQCIVGFDNAILNDSKSDILDWLQSEAEGE